LKPLREFGSPLLDRCAPMWFTNHQAMLDPSFPYHWWYYIRSCNLAELTDEAIDTLVDHGHRVARPTSASPSGARNRSRREAAPELRRSLILRRDAGVSQPRPHVLMLGPERTGVSGLGR
jgi:hypothetical protein